MLKQTAAVLLVLSAAACAQHHKPATEPAQIQKQSAMQTHTVASKYGFDETVSRLQNAVQSKGMTVFAVIDHREAAQQNGLDMQPAKVIIFGTPKAGTPLMQKDPAFALQLPLRVLVTETDGKVQAIFNDTRHLISGSKIEYADVENSLANAEKLIRATVAQ
ncbi:DUF302 domain-containing protein [Neisseria animalis]|uniref:DUF302 domain-containing protein n=1 Tax=Neisseria animalis TaxID=492 RepID=A0A5P3MVQ2_NEIAN|nr:DUF302 domain-containing protein [Neisseria animalis]QEY24841.1 DUF302 domain-containing protein [Neisseria animalis]ROW31560.1 DUF302 domain-containing protein [Neisseria animalis]VEE07982.1 Protein CrcB [Neisseria animalis]